MADYVEREAAIAAIKKDIMGGLNYESILKRIPSEDVQPVKHGKWVDEGFYADGSAKHAFHCSNCGHHIIEWKDDTSNYCPNCGADMREES